MDLRRILESVVPEPERSTPRRVGTSSRGDTSVSWLPPSHSSLSAGQPLSVRASISHHDPREISDA